jgi:hypothetical protein
MPDSLNELGILLAAFLPNLLLAVLVLVVGWLIALGISKLFESLLHRTSLDDRLAGMLRGGSPDRVPAERWISKIIFWVIMIFVLLIFLQMLNLGVVAAPINDLLSQVLTYIPKILAAAVLILLAVVIGAVLRVIITRLLSASGLSQRLSENAQVDSRNRITIGQTMGNVVFWLVILLFLPAILDTLDLQGILAPVQGMVDSILGALPNILGAIVVLGVGWLVARIIRAIVGNLLASTGIDSLGDRTGVQNVMREQRLSDVIAMIVFVLIMIPVVIAALNVLDIPAVSEPAANMLNSLLTALPAIFGAFLILAVAYFVGRLVAQLVSSLLAGIGFNRLFSAGGPIAVTGLNKKNDPTRPDIPVTGAADMPMSGGALQRTQPSDVVGWIVLVAILLFAVLQASQMLGFDALTALISAFIAAAGNILFGLVIFGVGLWLSGMAYRMIRNTGETGNTEILATTARVAIIVFAAALALQQMGIAESIVNLAFGLMLGAVAVAAAIAFGVGGRDVARDLLERWRGQLREQANRPAPPPPPPPSIPRTGQDVHVPPAPSDFDSDTRPIRRPDNQPFDEPGSFTDRIDRPDDVEDDELPPV